MVRDANLLGRFPCELSCPIKKHTLSLLLYAFKYTQYICVYVCCRSLNCLAWLYKSRLEKRKIFTVCWARVMSMRGCCYLQPKKKHEIIHRISFHVCGMQFVLSICDQKKYSHKAMLPLPVQHTDLHRLHIWNFTTNIFSHSLCRTFRINQHFICDLVLQNVHRITGNLLDFYSGKFRVEQATIDLFQTAISLATMPLTTNDMKKKKKYEEKEPIQPEALNKIYS